jgi:hypothetical protein
MEDSSFDLSMHAMHDEGEHSGDISASQPFFQYYMAIEIVMVKSETYLDKKYSIPNCVDSCRRVNDSIIR